MLVLRRKPGERLVVPHVELVVSVLAVDGKAVRRLVIRRYNRVRQSE